MTYILVVTGAINSAARLASQLEKSGCKKVSVVRTPIVLSAGGCSYSVKAQNDCLDTIKIISYTRRLRIKKIYSVTENGQECEYNDIS